MNRYKKVIWKLIIMRLKVNYILVTDIIDFENYALKQYIIIFTYFEFLSSTEKPREKPGLVIFFVKLFFTVLQYYFHGLKKASCLHYTFYYRYEL